MYACVYVGTCVFRCVCVHVFVCVYLCLSRTDIDVGCLYRVFNTLKQGFSVCLGL